jgi:hypothetical protein
MLLNLPHHNNLTAASSLRTPIPMSCIINEPLASSTANSPVNTRCIINEPLASSTANSPVRTQKSSPAAFIQSTFLLSPRHGAKSKQRRVDGILDEYSHRGRTINKAGVLC